MRQFVTIGSNAFMELVRQPIFLLLTTLSSLFIIFLSTVPYFGMGEDTKLVKDSALAAMLMVGLFVAVLSASASVAHEIRTGTALAVLAKPVGRAKFLLAKYCGLAAALVVLVYVNSLATLLASRMAFDAYGDADLVGLGIYFGSVALAYVLAGFSNYFLRRPFVSDAVLFLTLLTTIAFVLLAFFIELKPPGATEPGMYKVDYRLLPACVLVLLALLLLAGLALACSTRYDTVPTLVICTTLFLLGLMSDYLFGRHAEAGKWWATVFHTVLPNWQLFWLADAIEGTRSHAIAGVWGYVGKATAYVIGYLGASLAVALMLFEDRELS
ncbi:MAG: ABC transporter permease [Verrucomicrobia bacterium]|nr:ABC transporter permease [Verrucomicrobiota bacterium]MBM3869762.1 ABC transporter permease [Verrucomicrobiota bacterium]